MNLLYLLPALADLHLKAPGQFKDAIDLCRNSKHMLHFIK